VNMVMKLLVHRMLGNTRVAERLAVSQGGLSSMESVYFYRVCASEPCVYCTP
jgi:hypothetical protein